MPKRKKKRKCKYRFKWWKSKECPHEALEGKDVCYWHEERDRKNPSKELKKNDFRGQNLNEAYLKGANLGSEKFQGADLWNANLQGAYLVKANLQKTTLLHANLQGAFLNEADLQGADLVKADLQGAFLNEADLQGADLGEADLQGTRLGKANLQGADLWNVNLQGAHLWKTKLQGASLWEADFQGASLWNADLTNTDLENANIKDVDLHKTIFDNSNLWEAKQIDETIINEREGDEELDIEKRIEKYEEASQIYRNLKNYFKDEGIYDKSGVYYYRENVIKKKIYKLTSKWKYVGSLLLDLLCGYGEKPQRIIFSSLVWIFLNSIIFFILGIERGTTEISISFESCLSQNLINYLNCLYFSIGTFATLGYGDFHPLGITKAFAVTEAFSGAFMLALFVLTMGRKMMR